MSVTKILVILLPYGFPLLEEEPGNRKAVSSVSRPVYCFVPGWSFYQRTQREEEKRKRAMQRIQHTGFRGGIVALVVLTLIAGRADAIDHRGWTAKNENGGQRFTVLEEFNEEAVRDAETQLVWERSPSTTGTAWTSAPIRCAIKSVGGRKGWRLPSFYELMSLVDPSVTGSPVRPTLPSNHPFTDVKAASYWSVTSFSADSTNAYAVDFLIGDVTLHGKRGVRGYWCVRGGPSAPVPHRLNPGRQVVLSGPLKMPPS